MNLKSEINLQLALLCVCLEFLSLVIATKTLRGNGDQVVNEAIKFDVEIQEDLESIEHTLDNNKNEIIIATKDLLKPIAYLSKSESAQSENAWSSWPNVPLLPIVYPTSASFPDGPCKQQAQGYLRALKNETLWATLMYDASTKYPDGIISGYTRHLGNFDLCYNFKATLRPTDNAEPSLDGEEITGKYCLVDIEYQKKGLPPVDPLERHDLEFDPQGSVWEAIREKGDFRRLKRYLLQMALCVPEVCTAEDIEAALQEPFSRAEVNNNVQFNVSVKKHFCQALKDAPQLSQGAKIYCLVVILLLSLVVLCSWYDCSLKKYKDNRSSLINDLAQCFSAQRNLKTIMEIRSGHPGLDTMHLMRLLFVGVPILGHRALAYSATPLVNISYVEWLCTFDKVRKLVLHGPQVVEGCFAIGGTLTSYYILRHLDENRRMNFSEAIILRFVRLTPLYALVVFFNMTVLPYMGSGPYWEWRIGLERDSCASNWWTNLLFINNYVNPTKICLPQTWYSSVDFQLYVLAIFVTYAFWRTPRKYGFTFLCLVIFSGCVVPFVNSYFYNVEPTVIGSLSMHEIREFTYFTDHYVKTHERITSYFIGVLAGAILNDHKRNTWRLNKAASRILFAVSVLSFGAVAILTTSKYYDPNENPGRLEVALHACFFKGAFALACSSIVILITVGQGLTVLYNLLAPRWVQPLAKISYGAYLVHYTIQLYDTGVTRVAKQFTFHDLLWNSVSDAVFSFSLALLLAVTVEEPLKNIVKRFFMKSRSSTPASNEKTPRAKKTN